MNVNSNIIGVDSEGDTYVMIHNGCVSLVPMIKKTHVTSHIEHDCQIMKSIMS